VIQSINYLIVKKERRLNYEKMQIQEALLKEKRMKEEMAARLEAEKQAERQRLEEMQLMAKKRQEEKELAKLRKELKKMEIQEARKQRLEKEQAAKAKPTTVAQQVLKMRQSPCHPSRETLDIVYRRLPPIYQRKDAGPMTPFGNHVRSLKTAIPIEKPPLVPFSIGEEMKPIKWKKYFIIDS
jgi:hypothetical protein